MKSPPWKFVVGAFLVFAALSEFHRWRSAAKLDADTRECQGIKVLVDSTTTATCARLKADADELVALREAAGKLGGTAVAGVKVILRTDTLYLPPRAVPTDTAASARYAVLEDSTEDFVLRVEATAPPYPADLVLGASVTPVERTAEIGFVKTGSGYLAVVSGRGIRTTEAFFTPEADRRWALLTFGMVGGALVPTKQPILASTGLALQYRNATWQGQLEVGAHGVPYVGLRLSKSLF